MLSSELGGILHLNLDGLCTDVAEDSTSLCKAALADSRRSYIVTKDEFLDLFRQFNMVSIQNYILRSAHQIYIA